MAAMHYTSGDVLEIAMCKLPSLEPMLLPTKCKGWGERIRSARRRRRFNLVEGWTVKVSCWRGSELTGELVVCIIHK